MSVQERLEILRTAEPNTWVAFSANEDRVVARGPELADVVSQAQKAGESDPILTRIPPSWEPTLL